VKNIKILYEDEFILIIDKPAGLAVQGGKGVKTSLDSLLAQVRTPPPLLVHRLDKDTSGIILTAKEREAAARFSLLINGRKVIKQYIAVCAGCPGQKEGVITDKLLIRGSLKNSETGFKVVKTGALAKINLEYSILELELGTGRMHQIRRHLAMKGNPILGDDKYGDFSLNKKLKKEINLKRLLLHASRLVINDDVKLDVSAPLPEYFNSCLLQLT